MSNQPYISRQQSENFLAQFAEALNQPSSQPVLFHVYGLGGVGKSTLLKKLQEIHQQQADLAAVSFGMTEGIETPLKLMAKLYEQLPKPPKLWQRNVKDVFKSDPFTELYTKYQEVSHQLETQAVDGKKSVDAEQIKLVKQLLNQGASTIGSAVMPGIAAATLGKAAEASVDAAAMMLSEKDRIAQLLQQHQATKQKKELQELMLEPLPQLTQAFAQGLSQKAQKRPIVLMLDTYEKAPSDIDLWLCQSLLGNTELKSHNVRLIVAGRNDLLKTEYWRKLQQDRNFVYKQPLERFDREKTAEYLQQIGITEPEKVEEIYQATKGLPYYLNWIRREKEVGREINFSQGNEEIVQLLLQGLNFTQKLVLQLAACCRCFDKALIRQLMKSQGLDFDTAADDKHNCFEWLTKREFVEFAQHRYRLDDVARDVFRLSLWQDDREQFCQVQGWLADYFQERADGEVPADSPPTEQYNSSEWRSYIAEFLYHTFYSGRRDSQLQFISHLFASVYFGQDEVVTVPFGAITAEVDAADECILKSTTRQFLTTIQPAVEYSQELLQQEEIDWEFLEDCGFSQAQIKKALETCWKPINSLEGLAKFAALLYKSRRCPEIQRLDWLLKAKEQAEQIATPNDPEFSSRLFLWNVGTALYKLGQLEEAVASCGKALEFKRDFPQAWNNRGTALSWLGRLEQAVASYDKALEFKRDFPQAWCNRGLALYKLGRLEQAVASYDQALQIKPNYHEAWGNRGIVLSKLGRFEEALASYDKVLEIQPDNAFAFYQKARTYAFQGNVDVALENLQRAIHLNPSECRKIAETDSDFDSIREDARFQALIQGDTD